MKIWIVLFGYIKWHYTKALHSLFGIWRNFFVFIFNFFSISYLIKNLFDPWKRMSDAYPKSFSFKAYLFAFIGNQITRLVGLIMRLGLFFIGIAACLIFILLLPILVALWLILPIAIAASLCLSIYLIIK